MKFLEKWVGKDFFSTKKGHNEKCQAYVPSKFWPVSKLRKEWGVLFYSPLLEVGLGTVEIHLTHHNTFFLFFKYPLTLSDMFLYTTKETAWTL